MSTPGAATFTQYDGEAKDGMQHVGTSLGVVEHAAMLAIDDSGMR